MIDDHTGPKPFTKNFLPALIKQEGLEFESKMVADSIKHIPIPDCGRVPSTKIRVGCDPDKYRSYVVAFLIDGKIGIQTSIETGDIWHIIANAHMLMMDEDIREVHIFGYEPRGD